MSDAGLDAQRAAEVLRTVAGLDPAAAETLVAAGRLVNHGPGVRIWGDEANARQTGFLLAGIMRQQRYAQSGRRLIMNLILPTEAVLANNHNRPGYELETATEATFLAVSPTVFDRLREGDQSLSHFVAGSMQAQLDRLHWFTWSIAALNRTERICAFLDLASTFLPVERGANGGYTLTVSLSRRDVADLLSTSTETLSRTLRALDRENVIRLHAADRIEVPVPETLSLRATLRGWRPDEGAP